MIKKIKLKKKKIKTKIQNFQQKKIQKNQKVQKKSKILSWALQARIGAWEVHP